VCVRGREIESIVKRKVSVCCNVGKIERERINSKNKNECVRDIGREGDERRGEGERGEGERGMEWYVYFAFHLLVRNTK
jgi:hypothetical protein